MRERCEKRNFAGIVGREILTLSCVDSTNTYLKNAALHGAAEGTVVVADAQSAGRGRLGRSFQSPAGKGVYLSVLLRPSMPPERLLPVTALTAVAVCRALREVCGAEAEIKWPNDVLLDRRKIAGILTEAVMPQEGKTCLVIGIGINVAQTAEDFSPEVAALATSLRMQGKEISRETLVPPLLARLDEMYEALRSGNLQPWLAEYRRRCATLGKPVRLRNLAGGEETARAEAVDEQFGLVVRTAEGTVKTVRGGEVSVRGLYGYTE